MLKDAHIARLTSYVEELRERPRVEVTYEVPYFDPLDGGVNAKNPVFCWKSLVPERQAVSPVQGVPASSAAITTTRLRRATWKFMNEINFAKSANRDLERHSRLERNDEDNG